MGKLNMKNFAKSSGGDTPKESLDLESLENNPRYTAPEAEGGEIPEAQETVQEGAAAPEDNKPEGADAPEGGEAPKEGEEPKSEGGEAPTDSSLTDSNIPNEPTPSVVVPEVTDDLIFKSLSEKLGKEIKSFEDLQQVPQVELDPQIKAINEWVEKTNRPIEDFFKYQKDYTDVSDIDIARESLRIEYPTLTTDEINLEMERFVASEDDLDNEAAKKNLELKKYASQGRKVLDSLKAELGEPSAREYTPDVQSKLDYAEKVQKQIGDNESQQKEYFQNITQAADTYESLKLNLSDDLSIDFKVPDTAKKELPTLINDMPHWHNEDGSWNHQAVVSDAVKIKHFDAMIKLAYEQGQSSGKDNILKDAKNSTLGNVPTGTDQGTGTKRPIIEGIDKMLQRHQGQKIRFGKK